MYMVTIAQFFLIMFLHTKLPEFLIFGDKSNIFNVDYLYRHDGT